MYYTNLIRDVCRIGNIFFCHTFTSRHTLDISSFLPFYKNELQTQFCTVIGMIAYLEQCRVIQCACINNLNKHKTINVPTDFR